MAPDSNLAVYAAEYERKAAKSALYRARGGRLVLAGEGGCALGDGERWYLVRTDKQNHEAFTPGSAFAELLRLIRSLFEE